MELEVFDASAYVVDRSVPNASHSTAPTHAPSRLLAVGVQLGGGKGRSATAFYYGNHQQLNTDTRMQCIPPNPLIQ